MSKLLFALICALCVFPGCSAAAGQASANDNFGFMDKEPTIAVFQPGALTVSDTPNYDPAWTNAANRLVAHAGGNIDGVQGTDTIEAVEVNYNLGHRVFELDFNLTSDNVLAGIHDWGAKNIAPTWQEFASKKISGHYTPTTYEMFLRFLSTHKDAYMVTDTKSYDLPEAEIAKQFQLMYDIAMRVDPSVLDRIVVQVYNQPMYYRINKIYKYPNILYTLYETPDTEAQVLDFVERERIPVVVMPPERANRQFLDNLLALGERVYLHTLNDLDEVRQWQKKGVWGVYTDSLLPKDFETK